MAYAVESLAVIIKEVLNPDHQHLILIHNKPQIQSLLEKVNLLKDFTDTDNYWTTGMESRIRHAAQRGEYIIEAHMSDQILSSDSISFSSHSDLDDVMKEFDSINEEIVMIKKHDSPGDNLNLPLVVSSSPDPDPSSRNILVGMEEEFVYLRDLITGQQTELQFVAIIGKRGLGKTTLARKLYNDSSITNHYDTRLWITKSQAYNVRDSLLSLLESLRKLTSRMHKESDDELGQHILQILKGRRYLIVIDDISSTEGLEIMRRFFPDDANGSRIMLTSRSSGIAQSSEVVHYMRLLNDDESWRLLCLKVFAQGCCPLGFEDPGKRISKSCKGNALTIIVIAGVLFTSNMTLHFWESVAKNISPLSQLKIIKMGYNHLPHYLLPCFLYMGALREDYEIRASRIIRLWVAEGFIIPIANKTLEEIAEDYLKALIDRNLFMVCEQEFNGKVKTFSIPGVLRNLSQLNMVNERFMMVTTWGAPNIPKDTTVMCRMTCLPIDFTDGMDLKTLARSLYLGRASVALDSVVLGLRFLRILDVFKIELHQFPMEILQLVNLRYLAFTCRSALPSLISRFWNLQMLVIGRLPLFRAFALPSQVWGMTQLRHIKSKKACIWYCNGNGKNVIQENLQTLTNIHMSGVTNEALEKFPNLKKLGVFCNVRLHDVFDLATLHKLETLKCSSDWSMIPLRFRATVGSLPNLKQLRMQKSDFLRTELEPLEEELDPVEPEWETSEGEFPRLQSLLMEDLNLVHWTACSTNFPRLKRLVVRECCSLDKIPCDMGYIPTMELIEVDESSPSVLASAMQIKKEQKDLGNELLRVVVYRS